MDGHGLAEIFFGERRERTDRAQAWSVRANVGTLGKSCYPNLKVYTYLFLQTKKNTETKQIM